MKRILILLNDMNYKIDQLLRISEELTHNFENLGRSRSEFTENIPESFDVMSLIEIPDHLRRTILALLKLKKATADEIAKSTGRSRAIESSYLNQLVRLGYIRKIKVGKKAYFEIGE